MKPIRVDEFQIREAQKRRNTMKQDDTRCWMCGRELTFEIESAMLHVCAGGSLIMPDRDCDLEFGEDGCLGWWRIGPECAKKIPWLKGRR